MMELNGICREYAVGDQIVHALDHVDQGVEVERLRQHRGGVLTAGRGLQLRRRLAGHDDDRAARALEPAGDLPAVHVRHHQVEGDDIRAAGGRLLECADPVGRGDGLEALHLQGDLDQSADVGLVVDDQCERHGRSVCCAPDVPHDP